MTAQKQVFTLPENKYDSTFARVQGPDLTNRDLGPKVEREVSHLRNLNARLNKELKRMQYAFGIQGPKIEEVEIPDGHFEDFEDFAKVLNSNYYLSPLLTSYDDHLFNVERELKTAHMEIHHLHDHIRTMTHDNEILEDKLEIKMREYGKLVAETIENSQVVSNFEEEKQSLDKRNALLSEENQILLEQVAMLKSHFDSFNHDYSSKVVEADEKIAAFDELHQHHEHLLHSHNETKKQKEYLEI